MCMYSGISLARNTQGNTQNAYTCIYIVYSLQRCYVYAKLLKVYFVVQKGLLLLVGYFCLNCSLNRTQLNSKEGAELGINEGGGQDSAQIIFFTPTFIIAEISTQEDAADSVVVHAHTN